MRSKITDLLKRFVDDCVACELYADAANGKRHTLRQIRELTERRLSAKAGNVLYAEHSLNTLEPPIDPIPAMALAQAVLHARNQFEEMYEAVWRLNLHNHDKKWYFNKACGHSEQKVTC